MIWRNRIKRLQRMTAGGFLCLAVIFLAGFAQISNAEIVRKPYRLLVVVTPAAYAQIGSVGIRSLVNDRVISYSNEAYAGSPDSALVQLAGIWKTDSIEQESADTDLRRLTAWCNNSGYTLNGLRDLYAADLVTMVENNRDWTPGTGGIGGIGWVLSSGTSAYTCLNWQAISWMPAAPHEFGHNFGCLHDTAHDNSNWPFVYAHGYILSNGIDGTVMSYPPRYINKFSNPDSSYNYMPRGNERCNCTRVQNERIGAIAGFSNTQATVTVSNRSWRANEYGDIPATNSITISGQDTVKDTSELSLRSTGPITINSGFTVAKLGKLTINSSPGALAKRLSGEPGKHDEPQFASAQSELKFRVSAVKRQNLVTITYTLPSEQSVDIRIFDMRGRLIVERSVGAMKAGKHINNLLLGPICSNNIYMLELSTGSQREILKLVGNK